MNLNSTKKIMGGLTLAGLISLTGIVGFAQQDKAQGQGDREHAGREWKRGDGEGRRGGRGGGHGINGGFAGRFAEKLNLTDAQKEQMKQIAARHHESMKASRQQQRTRRGGGDFDGFSGGAFDENAVRTAAQARANAHVEMEVAHARMMHEMYNVLTSEQKAQLAAERQQREQKRQERRARRQGNNSGQQIQ